MGCDFFPSEEHEVTLESFDDGAREHVTVCGKTYTCLGDDDVGYRWSTGGGTGVRGCRIDSLAAAAAAVGCVVPSTAPAACRRQEPCLHTATDDTLRCYSQNSTSLPNELGAGLACTPTLPTTDTHVKSHIEQLGGLESYVLTPRPTPPSESVSSEPTSSGSASSSEPTSSDPASSEPVSSEPAPEAWQRCDVYGRPQRACNVDADCPLSVPAFDVWFAEAHKSAKGTRSAHAFLEALDHPDVTSTLPPSKRKAKTLQGVRTELRNMYENDPAFRTSVDAMLRDEYADAVAKKRYACDAHNRCSKAPTPVVRTTIVDETPVAFMLRGVNKVEYLDSDGVTREAHAVPCAETTKCRNQREYGFGDATRVQVDPTTDRGFVLRFRDGHDVYVANALHAKSEGECAVQLCARNADACPAPLCRLDEGECVPK